MASSGIEDLDGALGGGFPVPCAVLVEGAVESAKELLLYSFLQAKLGPEERHVFVTKGSVDEVLRDARAQGFEISENTDWIAGHGGLVTIDLENLASLSFSLKEILRRYSGRRIRVAFDVISPVLMRNSFDSVYRFLDQLISEVKRNDAVLISTVEPGMHSTQVLSSIEHLFDGVVSVEAPRVMGAPPRVRIRRMKGLSLAPRGTASVPLETEAGVGGAVEERGMAAIMFTDIVGYTAITQRDEARAMQTLRRQNEVLRPILARHRGREIKTIGDAYMVEFGSSLQAVQCALEVQETLSRLNKSASSEEDRLKLRIGIHMGDVIRRDNDLFGDAVNIASRIEPLAEPGGICVSDQVYGQIRNKITNELLKVEKVRLKNVSYPMDVYHVVLPWEQRPQIQVQVQESENVPMTRRVAILPLVNLSQDSQNDYFADGMTEELITSLSNVKDLRVIARTSVMRYKGTSKGISEIARELNVGSVVEGSVRKVGTKIRVKIQMIDGRSEEHVLAASFDRDMVDIFAVQTEIAAQVSKTLKAKVRAVEKRRIEKKPTESVDAYSLYLKGRFVLHKRTKQSMEEAISNFEEAISRDQRYSRAYAGLADAYLLLGSYGYLDAKHAYAKARDEISKALDLDDDLAEAHVSLGFLLETYYYDFVAARREFERAVALSPSYEQARHWYAINLSIFGEVERGVSELEKAQEIDPLSPQVATVLGGFYTYVNRDSDALFQWNKALMSNPDNIPIHLNRGLYYARVGKRDDALADVKRAVELSSGAANVKCIEAYVEAVLGYREVAMRILDEVKESSKLEYVPPFYLAIVYAALMDKTEAFAQLERSVEDKSVEVESLINDSMFESVRTDPRYEDVLRRIGVPRAGQKQATS